MENKTSSNVRGKEEVSLRDIIIKIKEWWRYLLSKWIIIFLAGLFGGVLGFTYAYLKKPTYKAELSFALEDDKPGGLGAAAGIASQFGIDIGGGGGGAFSGDNLLELMKSRSMVQKALLTTVNIKGKDQTLAQYYISINNLRSDWKDDLKNVQFLPGADASKFSRQQDSLLGVFHKALIDGALSVDKKDKKLSIITVGVVSGNELFSKLFVEVLTKTVSNFYIDTKTKKSVQNVSILQFQTDSVRKRLNEALTGVASDIDAVPNANPGMQVLRAPSQHRQVDVQINQAILIELVKNLTISRVSLRKETPLVQVIDMPVLPLTKIKTSKLISMIVVGFLFGLIAVVVFCYKKLAVDLKL